MKLVISISRDDEANRLVEMLVHGEFRVTRINSAGGFLKKGNATIVVGIEDEKVDEVVGLIRDAVEHANVFVLNVNRYEKL